MGSGRTHSREFKLMVVRQIVNGEKRPAQVCREHDLTESLVLCWRREYAVRGEAIFEHARRGTLDWFPMLRGIRFTHSWGGVYGRPRDHMPTMAYDRRTGIATAYGYTGSGVSTANLSGRLLADQITERDTDLTTLPMATHHSPNWEPEPLRWLGVRYVSWGMRKLTEETERTGKVPNRPTLKLAQRWFDW